MGLEDLTLRVTKHAFEQYTLRVSPIDIVKLRELLTEQVASGDFIREREYLKLDDVWWVYEIVGPALILITCYGRTHVYIPAALRWAKLHNDRISLRSEVISDDDESIGQTKAILQ